MKKYELPCEIVDDILPSYVDGLTNEVTNKAVDEHIAGCPDCQNKLRAMNAPDPVQPEEAKKEIDFLKKTRRRNILLIIAGVFLTIVLALAAMIYFAFEGSPIRKARFTKEARAYVAETYPNEGYTVSKAVYDFKCNTYVCTAYKEGSKDIRFRVYPDSESGKVRDDYESSVGGFSNTMIRLAEELDAAADEALADLPYRTRLTLASFYDWEADYDRMYLDMPLDLTDVPAKTELILWAETSGSAPTYAEAEELLRAVKAYAEGKGLHFDYYSLSLEYPYVEAENGELVPTDYSSIVHLTDVPAEIIDDPAALHEFAQAEEAAAIREIEEMEKGNFGKDAAIQEP